MTTDSRTSNAVEWKIFDLQVRTVKLNNAKGFGFISVAEKSEDIFVHFHAIQGDGYRSLNEGHEVELTLVEGAKAMQAENVIKRWPIIEL